MPGDALGHPAVALVRLLTLLADLACLATGMVLAAAARTDMDFALIDRSLLRW